MIATRTLSIFTEPNNNKVNNQKLYHNRRSTDHGDIDPAEEIGNLQFAGLDVSGPHNGDQKTQDDTDDHGKEGDFQVTFKPLVR